MSDFRDRDRTNEISPAEQDRFATLIAAQVEPQGITIPTTYAEFLDLDPEDHNVGFEFEPVSPDGSFPVIRLTCQPIPGTTSFSVRRELDVYGPEEEVAEHLVRSLTRLGLNEMITDGELERTPYASDESAYRPPEEHLMSGWYTSGVPYRDFRPLLEEYGLAGEVHEVSRVARDRFLGEARTFTHADLTLALNMFGEEY